jgi:hypothetical protein
MGKSTLRNKYVAYNAVLVQNTSNKPSLLSNPVENL